MLAEVTRNTARLCIQRRAFSSSACALQAPVPRATRPSSQANTAIPRNVYDLTVKYPRHPLLAFFRRESRKVVSGADGKTTEELVPVAVPLSSMQADVSGRSWNASELRTKSSVQLHQLWYICLMERNKLATTKAELQRMGVLMYADLAQYNGKRVEARIRKTMARIKFVLNERRIALLDAQEKIAEEELWGEEEETEGSGDEALFETLETEPQRPSN